MSEVLPPSHYPLTPQTLRSPKTPRCNTHRGPTTCHLVCPSPIPGLTCIKRAESFQPLRIDFQHATHAKQPSVFGVRVPPGRPAHTFICPGSQLIKCLPQQSPSPFAKMLHDDSQASKRSCGDLHGSERTVRLEDVSLDTQM